MAKINFKISFLEFLILSILFGIIFAIFFTFYFFDLRINTNPSIAIGLYKLQKTPAKKGDYVSFCPPDNINFLIAQKREYLQTGFCSNGTMPMMKKIIAVKNDTINIDQQNGIFVNGQHIKESKPFEKDGNNLPLPQLKIKNYTLKNDEILVFGDNNKYSFDSRYFGTIPKNSVLGVLKPVILFK